MAGELLGLDKLNRKLAELRFQAAQAAGAGQDTLARAAAARMRATAPRGPSGDIRGSIRVERVNDFRTDVVVGELGQTYYLGFYEFGARGHNQPARPFVRPAAGLAEASFESVMKGEARKRIR